MKTIFKFLLLTIISLFIFIACDKISAPYTENGNNTTPPDTTGKTVKTVLIEDYTGHTCPNCPGAAVIAEQLKETYGNNKVIVIAVHAGTFAKPNPGTVFTLDLRSGIGNEWDSYFGISSVGNPKGLIDRVTFPEGMILSKDKWNAKVVEELDKPVTVSLKIQNSFNNTNKKLTSTISGKFLQNLEGEYFLQVCITEDSIIGAQLDGDNLIENYVFMGVLRAGMNTNWGEHISENGSVTTNEKFEKTYAQTLNSEWVPKNCHVVAFVYLNSDKSILQTAEKKVIEN